MRGLLLTRRALSDLIPHLPKALLRFPVLLGVLLTAQAQAAPSEGATETVEQALCRLIDGSAKAQGLPVPFLTRLIWRESSFRVSVVSPVGAQGVAQFMPGTAQERGLLDPFDPEQAIPHAAHLLADLKRRFGNLGLAAAAYNGGPARVTNWLAGSGGLPAETRAYVLAVTGRSVEEWREGEASSEAKLPEAKPVGKSATVKAQDTKPGEQTTKTEGPRGEDANRKSGRTEKPGAEPAGWEPANLLTGHRGLAHPVARRPLRCQPEQGCGSEREAGSPALGTVGHSARGQLLEGACAPELLAGAGKLCEGDRWSTSDDHRHAPAHPRHPGLLPHPHPSPEPAGCRRTLWPDPHRRWRLHRPEDLRGKICPLGEAMAAIRISRHGTTG